MGLGANSAGQLGDSTTIDSNIPVRVNSLAGVVAIEGGGDQSLALKNDGTVWAWGDSDLGDGPDSSVPVQVPLPCSVTAHCNTDVSVSIPQTNNQLVCINNPITNINYTITAASNAIVTGLPPGVTSNYTFGKLSISGTPNIIGTYTYTVTIMGICKNKQTTTLGNITVKPNVIINLTSPVGSDSQIVCVNTPITNITYSVNDSLVKVIGLPTGVYSTYVAGVVTIYGTLNIAGIYDYTLTSMKNCTQRTGVISECPFKWIIPNIFSPNYDNINDVFTINVSGAEKINLEIFNRWGWKIYESSSLNKGWDGCNITNGLPADEGTYYYVANAIDSNGQGHTAKGFLTLVR